MGFFSAIPAGLYAFVLRIRHLLYDSRIIKRYRADIPVVCVGNITVGGTGKTPVTEYLIDRLEDSYTVAVLSRGYGRRTKGYREVGPDSSFLDVGDEPKLIKRNHPSAVVVVCEKRAEGIARIRREHPEVDLILLDDGFQHRRVDPKVNIVLVDYTRPVWEDHLLPWGRLRDLPSQMDRANIVIVTKTPPDITPIDHRIAVKSLKLFPYQSVVFTSMVQGEPVPLFPDAEGLVKPGRNVALLAGIGNPRPLADYLSQHYELRAEWLFRDHYVYKVRDLKRIVNELAALPEDTVLFTTGKDAVKLCNRKKIPVELQRRLYRIPVGIAFPDDDEKRFLRLLSEHIASRE
jgi:tetraacyldisaccharide 4'-kinase